MLWLALYVSNTIIKSKEHFRHFQEELLSDIHQLPGEGIHALSTHITFLISQCKFTHPLTQEVLKIMVLKHAM